MADENLLLTDKDTYPDDDVIFSIIGEKKKLWLMIMNHMSDVYKGSEGKWNFYNDGKRWLFKMTYRKKTVFWAGILQDTFRITFYLGNKAEGIIENSALPQNVKDDFKNAKPFGTIRPISFIVRDERDVDNILTTIDLKVRLK